MLSLKKAKVNLGSSSPTAIHFPFSEFELQEARGNLKRKQAMDSSSLVKYESKDDMDIESQEKIVKPQRTYYRRRRRRYYDDDGEYLAAVMEDRRRAAMMRYRNRYKYRSRFQRSYRRPYYRRF